MNEEALLEFYKALQEAYRKLLNAKWWLNESFDSVILTPTNIGNRDELSDAAKLTKAEGLKCFRDALKILKDPKWQDETKQLCLNYFDSDETIYGKLPNEESESVVDYGLTREAVYLINSIAGKKHEVGLKLHAMY